MNGEVRDWGTMRRMGPMLVVMALVYMVPLAIIASQHRAGAALAAQIMAAIVLLMLLLLAIPSWLTMGRFVWDDIGLRRRAIRHGWSLAWSDLVDCGVKRGRLGAPAFELTCRDGATHTAALSGVSPKDRRLFDELMRRTASLRARQEAALDARDLEILPSAETAKMMRDLRRVMLVIAAMALVLVLLGALGWFSVLVGTMDPEANRAMIAIGGMSLLLAAPLALSCRTISFLLNDEGITRRVGRRARTIPWPAVEELALRVVANNGQTSEMLEIKGCGTTMLLTGGDTLWCAALRRVLTRASQAEVRSQVSAGTHPWWAEVVAAHVGESDVTAPSPAGAVSRGWRFVFGLAVMVLATAGQVLIRTIPTAQEARRTVAEVQRDLAEATPAEALATKPCSLDSDRPHVHYEFRVAGDVFTGRLATPNGAWRRYPTGTPIPVAYRASDPSRNWPVAQPPEADGPQRLARMGRGRRVLLALVLLSALMMLAARPHLRQRNDMVRQAKAGPGQGAV